MTANGRGAPFRSGIDCCGGGFATLCVYKNHQTVHLQTGEWYVNYISIKLFFFFFKEKPTQLFFGFFVVLLNENYPTDKTTRPRTCDFVSVVSVFLRKQGSSLNLTSSSAAL